MNAFLGVCEQGSILMADAQGRPKNKKMEIRVFP